MGYRCWVIATHMHGSQPWVCRSKAGCPCCEFARQNTVARLARAHHRWERKVAFTCINHLRAHRALHTRRYASHANTCLSTPCRHAHRISSAVGCLHGKVPARATEPCFTQQATSPHGVSRQRTYLRPRPDIQFFFVCMDLQFWSPSRAQPARPPATACPWHQVSARCHVIHRDPSHLDASHVRTRH